MFLTDLIEKRVIESESTYELVAPLIWKCKDYYFEIPEGFRYDGASVPWIASRLFPRKGRPYDRAACLHDYLYATHLLTRKQADKLFYKAMLSDSVSKWRAYIVYQAVNLFGSSAYNAKEVKGAR